MTSKVIPISSVTTVPPVKTAISYNKFFLLSPKAGALTQATLTPFLNLFKTLNSCNYLKIQLSGASDFPISL